MDSGPPFFLIRRLTPGFKVGYRSGLFGIGHIGVATNHLDLPVDEGSSLSTVLFCLRCLEGKDVAHVDNRAGRFARLFDYQRRFRRGVNRHSTFSAPPAGARRSQLSTTKA